MKQHLDDLSQIRSIMERSARFISLSGLSGISAGIFAIIGALVAYNRISEDNAGEPLNLLVHKDLLRFIVIDGIVVLTFSLIFSFYFTTRQAQKQGQKLWDNTSKRLLINMAVPLVAGGFFCLILMVQAPHLIDCATLVFYGLALVNASKYTYDDVRYLGYLEIVLGLTCGLMNDWQIGLLFWTIGFGLLHIIYGALMYKKYEKTT